MPLFSWQQLSRLTAPWQAGHGRTINCLTLLQMLTISSKEKTDMSHCQLKALVQMRLARSLDSLALTEFKHDRT
ncbi:hypothetical protein HOQ57_gp20 [uncultured phage_MedDCM-OCT-S39-C11]|uniref:Uncharacterized protein n=1 Tax=uncultured phage_MedDCM-OCT-S39-C11 TaxID=2740805 RepID=A0A6S4PAV9_9CAUD|nr:hypothetical protein HOQ57_gp20 [uncultured phage_MedDCM-OCT-S39-C11]BAQ94490.1 hypothetical protein [uncultured phage_MedDCM-OCT-S39-C11]